MPYLLFLLIIQSPANAEELHIDIEQLDTESMLKRTGTPPVSKASPQAKQSPDFITEWQQPSPQDIPRTLSTNIDNLPSVRQFSNSNPEVTIQEIHITVQ